MLSVILTAIAVALIGWAALWCLTALLMPVYLWVLYTDSRDRPQREANLREAQKVLAEIEAEQQAHASASRPLRGI